MHGCGLRVGKGERIDSVVKNKNKKKNEVSSPLLSRSFATTALFQHDVGPWPLVTCLARAQL